LPKSTDVDARFNLNNVTSADVEIQFLSKDEEKDKLYKKVIDTFRESKLSEIYDLDFTSLQIYQLSDFFEKMSIKRPIISINKENYSILISPTGIRMTIPSPQMDLSDDTKFNVKMEHLNDASDLINKILLILSGVVEKKRLMTETQFTFQMKSKVEYLDHLIDTKRLDSAEKLNLSFGMAMARFKFKMSDMKDEYEIRIRHPTDEISSEREMDQIEIRCELKVIDKIDIIDISGNFEKISDITSKAALILGV